MNQTERIVEAVEFIKEWGIDPDNYVSANFKQFMSGDVADDNSCELHEHHQESLKIVVKIGLKTAISEALDSECVWVAEEDVMSGMMGCYRTGCGKLLSYYKFDLHDKYTDIKYCPACGRLVQPLPKLPKDRT